jgi:hypothetical protein
MYKLILTSRNTHWLIHPKNDKFYHPFPSFPNTFLIKIFTLLLSTLLLGNILNDHTKLEHGDILLIIVTFDVGGFCWDMCYSSSSQKSVTQGRTIVIIPPIRGDDFFFGHIFYLIKYFRNRIFVRKSSRNTPRHEKQFTVENMNPKIISVHYLGY